MDARVMKLKAKLGGDRELAEQLVKRGLDSPKKIKAAPDKDILAIPGVGQSRLAAIRNRCPKVARKVL